MRRNAFFAVAALIGLLIASPAHAAPLSAGGSVAPSVLGSNPLTTDTIIDHTSGIATQTTAGVTLTVSYDAWVGRNGGGTLDFIYQFTNSSSSNTSVDSTTHAVYDSFTTDVSYYQPGGDINPVLATRTSDGQTVKFFWKNPTTGVGADVAPGQTSTIQVISTNAVYYTAGTYSFQDGVTANGVGFAPTLVPEPSTMALVGLGALGFVAYGLRRRVRTA